MPYSFFRQIFLTGFLLICSSLLIHTVQADYIFVSPKGKDTNSGTINAPYLTIAKAIKSSTSGDTIFLRSGIYYELTRISNYGQNATDYLTIKPYNNEQVIIDGSKRNQQDLSSRSAFYLKNSHFIRIENLIIQNIVGNDRSFYPSGILIRDGSSNVVIKNNELRNIANLHPKGNANGIIVYGNTDIPISNIVLEKNYLHHLQLGNSESLTISGNVVNFQIISNTLFQNNNIGIDIAGHYGACETSGCIDIARYGVIANNTIQQQSSVNNPAYSEGSSAGIYVDGGRFIRIINNRISANDYGISLGSENENQYTENIFLTQNVISFNRKAGLVLGGSSKQNGGAKNIEVFQNLFKLNDQLNQGYKEITIQNHNSSITFDQNTYQVCYPVNFVNFAVKDYTALSMDNLIYFKQVKQSC
jgi:pectate disaccharide-lyase